VSEAIDLGYDPQSLLGPLSLAEVREFEGYLHSVGQPIVLDGVW
jgi:hypothetical protein